MEPVNGIAATESLTTSMDSISVYCIYSANPSTLLAGANGTRWFKDGHLLDIPTLTTLPTVMQQQQQQQPQALTSASAANGRLVESRTPTGYPVLTINRPNRRDSGHYECQVSNQVGQSERLPLSDQCRVEITHRPKVGLRVFRLSTGAPDSNDRASAEQDSWALDESSQLAEVNLDADLVLTGARFVLQCDVLEANPSKILKFHWYSISSTRTRPMANKKSISASRPDSIGEQHQTTTSMTTHNVSEANRFVIGPIGSDFKPTKFSCAATNAMGQSDRSDPIGVRLSHAPGE